LLRFITRYLHAIDEFFSTARDWMDLAKGIDFAVIRDTMSCHHAFCPMISPHKAPDFE
jgi:hypothetical protein